MKYLQGLNWVLLAAGAMMTLVLSVVTLIMAIYRDEAAQIGGSFDTVAAATVAFAVFTAVSALAVWGLRRGAIWAWPAQGALALSIYGLVEFVRQL